MRIIYMILMIFLFQNCKIPTNFNYPNYSIDENDVLPNPTYFDSLYINGFMLNPKGNDKSKMEIDKVINRLKVDIAGSKSKVDKFYASSEIMKLQYHLDNYKKVDSLKKILLEKNIDNSYIHYLSGLMFENDNHLDSATVCYSKSLELLIKGSPKSVELEFLISNEFDDYISGIKKYGATNEFIQIIRKNHKADNYKYRREYVTNLLMSYPNLDVIP